MKEGDVALAVLPQVDRIAKPRPVVLLTRMPPFGDWLVCGVTTQLHHEVPGFDDVLAMTDADFAPSGLKTTSLIRPGFLAVLPVAELIGQLGEISVERHARLVRRLAALLNSSASH